MLPLNLHLVHIDFVDGCLLLYNAVLFGYVRVHLQEVLHVLVNQVLPRGGFRAKAPNT
jgi:hypothetical protein